MGEEDHFWNPNPEDDTRTHLETIVYSQGTGGPSEGIDDGDRSLEWS
jgi:hypothetical protein